MRQPHTFLIVIASLAIGSIVSAESSGNWHQAAGPNGNWQTEGSPPVEWSATRGENIRWRTPMPEAGMSNVTIWGDRVFVTTHVPIRTLKEKEGVKDILGFCLDASTGKVLWKVTLPGSVFISLAGGFTDGTVFAPICDGQHVWFFNRCGSMGCYDLKGNRVWLREWTPRFKHNNRQAEPYLIGNAILYVEVANKKAGAKIQKWAAPGKKSKSTRVPEGVDEKEVWTYLHGIDKLTGKVLWREKVGTSVHNTPVVGRMADGKPAVAHARGGPHKPLEKPAGQSLTSLAPGEEGKTLWSTDLTPFDPSYACHWNEKFVFGFQAGRHLVLDVRTGKVLRKQQLYESATLWKFQPTKDDWTRQTKVAVRAGKGHPNTNQANLVIGDWHWFLSHNVHYLGRVNVETGAVGYLELPAQLMPSVKSRQQDVRLWGRGHPANRPLNVNGFAVGDKGHNGTGWGHISAASPTRVGRYLFLPVVTGTVYVIDTSVKQLSPKSLVAVNDLGPGGETWTLSSLTFSRKWDLAKHAQRGFFIDLFPTRQGFDYFYGTPTSNDRIANLYRNEKLIEPKTDMATLTQRYTDEAIGFMKKHQDKPFFVYIPHTMPHTRLDASKQFKGKSKRGLYGDVIEEIDFNVGRILDAITKMGLAKNTYVLFTSDNGPWLIKNKNHADGRLRTDHGGSAGPLRSGKVSTFEGGVRVPTILWGPGRVPAGKTCDRIASTLDVLPTFAALAGAKTPQDRVIDGKDISHLFHGQFDKADPNRAFYYYLRVHLQAVRQGKWKLHLPREKEPVGAAPFSRNNHIAPKDRIGFRKPFLVDLSRDIGETTNVANQHPEVVKRLLALAEAMREDLGDHDRVGKNMRFFDLPGARPKKPPVPNQRKKK